MREATGSASGIGGARSVRSARPLLFGQLLKFALQMASLPLLARILSPDDFGAVAVALAIVGVGEILRDAGLSIAAVTSPQLSKEQQSALLWLNVILGFIAAGAALLIAVPASIIFANDRLDNYLVVLSVAFIVGGVCAQYRADLNRRMRFARMAAVDVSAAFVGVLSALLLAVAGAGPWALVAQPIAVALTTLAVAVALNPWIPELRLRRTGVRPLVRFAWNYSGAQLIGYVGNNVDAFALGLRSSQFEQGLYNRSYQLAIYPLHQLKSPATAVALPLLSRATQSGDALSRQAATAQRLLAYTVLPAGLLLASVSSPVVDLVLGNAWSQAGPVVALLAIAGALQQVSAVPGWVLTAIGAGSSLRRFAIVSLAVKCVLIATLVSFGATGVAAGYLASVIVVWPLLVVWTSRRARLDLKLQFQSLLIPVGLSATAFAIARLIAEVRPDNVPIVMESAAFVAVFGVACVSPTVRCDVKQIIGLVVSRRRN